MRINGDDFPEITSFLVSCPPWNDEKIHHYHFTLYAIALDRCPVAGIFTATDVLQAIEGQILETASLTGTYQIYPDAK